LNNRVLEVLKSLKVTKTSTIRKLGSGFLFAFPVTTAVFLTVYEIFRSKIAWPWKLG